MRTLSPVRIGGIALVIGAVLAFSPISPGKDTTIAGNPTWVPGHLIDMSSYVFLLLGLPAVYGALRERFGLLGLVGHIAFVIRLTLSSASQFYEARIVPTLVTHPGLTAQLRTNGALYTIYGSWNTPLSITLSVIGAAYGIALLRTAPKMRWCAALIGLGSLASAVIPPLGIVLFSVGFGWLGLRIIRHGTPTTPLRRPRTSDEPADVEAASAANPVVPV